MPVRPDPTTSGMTGEPTVERIMRQSASIPLQPATPLEYARSRRDIEQWTASKTQLQREGWQVERDTRTENPSKGTYYLLTVWHRPVNGSRA